MSQNVTAESITLAGGCFWCIEAVFKEVEGVISAVSGYTGGHTVNPNYRQVCNDNTGHAEAVQVTFDPAKISYREILEIFFSIHDPTTLNRQGADTGTQYRSAIFYIDEKQKTTAEEIIQELNKEHIWNKPIVTQLVPIDKFYPAEGYHLDYFTNNPEQGYCQIVISPKIAKFRKKWAHLLKK